MTAIQKKTITSNRGIYLDDRTQRLIIKWIFDRSLFTMQTHQKHLSNAFDATEAQYDRGNKTERGRERERTEKLFHLLSDMKFN